MENIVQHLSEKIQADAQNVIKRGAGCPGFFGENLESYDKETLIAIIHIMHADFKDRTDSLREDLSFMAELDEASNKVRKGLLGIFNF